MNANRAFRETRAERRTEFRPDAGPRVEPREISGRVIIELVVRLQTGSRKRRASAGRPFDGVRGGGNFCH
jgi:hypothetical protein